MPLIPMVSNIHINYKASDVIELTQDAVNFQEINHIHPFGYEKSIQISNTGIGCLIYFRNTRKTDTCCWG